jgi:hypothetical protein
VTSTNQNLGTKINVRGRENIARIFGYGARKNDTIGLAEPTAVARVNRVMKARLVDMAAGRGRDALVDEKSQAALPRPGARPAGAFCRR